ncbi:MAG TPA: RagB/SusD family nutrient uptake outer membrane protein [Chitinophagaceae bacterium]|nr:RagB/SusD family nutrient uptake outer membrane protein [Chitinophagaceae bacterium]
MKHNKILLSFLVVALVFISCTKLNERYRSELAQGNTGSITAGELLVSAYSSIQGTFQGNGNLISAAQVTSDETIVPTRAGDWDDNGLWRSLFLHTWNADHSFLSGAYSSLLGTQFAASNVLQFSPSPQQAAEARFLMALSMFWVLDGWDQVPYREDLVNYKLAPKTLKGTEAADFIISELNAIMNTLPDGSPTSAFVANKDAARALLMKMYLNKGVYANRAAPTFAAADMTQVITLADQIIGTNKYALNDNFFDAFAPDNDVKSKENIFSLLNTGTSARGSDAMRGFQYMVNHYNMNPGGWNGWSTLSDFYDKFEATDQRRGVAYSYPGSLPNPGNRVNVGFLIGQQYDLTTGTALNARNPASAPLAFTKAVKIRETDPNTLELAGVRAVKYAFDYGTSGDFKKNDYVMFRYADILLMKAEAMVRSSNAAGALPIVNSIRAKRGATALASVDLNALLDERGRELYWESWRRQDLIRFGKYLLAWQEKPADAGTKNLLFPIPSSQLAVNPNLTQNPGY